MLVKQLVGRYAGQVVDMPFVQAQGCIRAGTAVAADHREAARNDGKISVPKDFRSLPYLSLRSLAARASGKKVNEITGKPEALSILEAYIAA